MGRVTADVSMSLDGFITGPRDGVDLPLGEGGERLHEWVYDLASFRERHGQAGGKTDRDDEVLREALEATGAFLMGRRMFDVGEEPWGDDPPFHRPVFVVTHTARPEVVKEGGTTFTFVTDGLKSLLLEQEQQQVTRLVDSGRRQHHPTVSGRRAARSDSASCGARTAR